MKRTIFMLVFAATALNGAAQDDTIIVKSKSVALYPDDSGEKFSINVSGLVIGFGKRNDSSPSESEEDIQPTSTVKRKSRHTHFSPKCEFGFNYLLAPDYSNYPEGTKEFLDLRPGKSIHFGWNLFNGRISLNRRNTFAISPGLTCVWRDYAFSDRNMTIAKEKGRLAPVPVEGNFKKSKLSVSALRIPVLLTITDPQSKTGIEVGGYVDFVTIIHTKYKFPKNKEFDDFYVNPVQFGLQVRVRLYNSDDMFVNYGFSNMFQKDKAPTTRPLTIGLGFGF